MLCMDWPEAFWPYIKTHIKFCRVFRDLNSTNKRLSNCIDYNKKTIKLKRILDSCDEEDSQKVNSLKRVSLALL